MQSDESNVSAKFASALTGHGDNNQMPEHIIPRTPNVRSRTVQDVEPGANVVRKAFWPAIDQFLNTLSNFVLTASVARLSTPTAFGAFALAYGFAVLIIATSQAFITETLLVISGRFGRAEWNTNVRRTVGLALMVGAVGSVLLGATAFALPEIRSQCLVLAAALPAVLVQDNLRLAMIGKQLGTRSAANDATWVALQAAGLAGASVLGVASSFLAVVSWTVPAYVCAFLACAQLKIFPDLLGGLCWARDHCKSAGSYVIESLAFAGTAQFTLLAVSLTGSLVATASLRAGQTIFGPLSVVFIVLRLYGISAAGQGRSKAAIARIADLMALLGAGVGVIATITLLAAPTHWGITVFGDSWRGARAVLLPMGLQKIATGFSTGSFVCFRLAQNLRTSMISRIGVALVQLVAGVVGASVAGLDGCVWSLAVASVLCAGYIWAVSRRALKGSRSLENLAA